MATFRVEPTDKALEDAADAYVWTSGYSEDAALHWYQGLMKALRSLSRNPFRCSLAPESAFFPQEIRHLIYAKYRILFTVEKETVFVLRIRHVARDYLDPAERWR